MSIAEPRTHAIAAALALADPATSIRPYTANDHALVRALFREDRAAMFQHLGLPAPTVRALLDQQFEAQRIGYAQSYPHAEHLVVMHHGRAVGRLLVTLHAESAALRLIDILISAAMRGRGIGTDVLSGLVHAAGAIGAAHVELSVLQTNAGARRLYQRLGYTAVADGVHISMVKRLT